MLTYSGWFCGGRGGFDLVQLVYLVHLVYLVGGSLGKLPNVSSSDLMFL